MKKKTLTLAKLKGKLQPIFNKWIRQRDAHLPCISCGVHQEYYDAGHYYPVKQCDGLRFDEDNCHKECKGCNGFDKAHLIGYTNNLPARIGQTRYEKLTYCAAEYKKSGNKWTRAELEDKIIHYTKLLK